MDFSYYLVMCKCMSTTVRVNGTVRFTFLFVMKMNITIVTSCDLLHCNPSNLDISDKVLKDRTCEIARNRGYDGYQRALASMVYKFFDKKSVSGISVNEQRTEELHKSLTKKFKRRKV